tara:strand:+ start:243 stop:365 length:123 start_codon:yes stop_codon:yes gene_type:complete
MTAKNAPEGKLPTGNALVDGRPQGRLGDQFGVLIHHRTEH